MEDKLTKREELIQELETKLGRDILWEKDVSVEQVADFILSRERLLLEKIGKPLKKYKNTYSDIGWQIMVEKASRKAIDEALTIIEKEGNHAR